MDELWVQRGCDGAPSVKKVGERTVCFRRVDVIKQKH
jgi:hypothetical protein